MPATLAQSFTPARRAQEVVLSITDEGPGVKPAELERIFEKFYRGGRADGRKAGTGLGLSISRGFVEAMGGASSPQARPCGGAERVSSSACRGKSTAARSAGAAHD